MSSVGRYIIMLCICAMLQGAMPQWDIAEDLALKKDEPYMKSFSLAGLPKELKLSWTLYKNYGLVMHVLYDKFPHQFVLYADYARESFTLPLSRGHAGYDAYLLLRFKDFDEKEQIAHVRLLIMLPKKPSSS